MPPDPKGGGKKGSTSRKPSADIPATAQRGASAKNTKKR